MLNGIEQPVNDSNEISRRSLQPYQSIWLAHWKRTGSDAGGDGICPGASRSEEPYYSARKDGLSKEVEASRSVNGFGSIRNRTLEIGYNFSKIGRKSVGRTDGMISSPNGQGADAFSRLYHPKESFVESSYHDFEADKLNKGKEAAVSDSSRRRSTDMRTLEHEQCCETHVICERTVALPSQLDHSSDECLRGSGSCDHCLSMINNAWFSKMQKYSGIRLSPSQSNSSEENESMKSRIDCYSKLKLQKCDHGLGTSRMCSSMDVPGKASASQSNTDWLITNKTSFDAFKANDTFRSRRVISNIDGNLSSNVHSILPFFGRNKHKVQLQSLSSPDDSKVKEYMRDSRASKVTMRNNLPSETDTLEIEKQHKKSPYSASNSTSSTKVLLPSLAFNMESNEVVFPRKVQNTCPSSTKSLTIDNEKLLELANQPKSKSDLNLDDCQNGSRWVKRLKLSSSNYSIQGETTPNVASSTPRGRTSKLFNGIPRSNSTKTVPNLKRRHNGSSGVTDKIVDLSETNEEDALPNNSNDKAKALLLSQAWVQRWLRSGGRETKRESSRSDVEKLEREPLPSIAAMALMAKVLTCFQECELQKRGSYTVWNTKTV